MKDVKTCPRGTKKIRGRCVTKKQKKPYVHRQYVGTTKAVKPVDGKGDSKSFDMFVLEPSAAPAQKLTQDDVWGKTEMESEFIPKIPVKWIHHGKLVATSHDDGLPKICPIWKDELRYKSVTVICNKQEASDCEYWLEYVHGGGSVSKRKELPGGKIAFRSDYQAW